MKTGIETALAFLAGLGTVVISATAAEIHEVELVNGETLEAIVVPASDCPVVLQTEDLCLEVPIDKIRSIDGSRDVCAAIEDGEPAIVRNETFEELLPNGDVLLRSSFSRMNRNAEARHQISWGIGDHEVPLLDHWKVFDEFGHELDLHVHEEKDGRRRAVAALRRPILPGELVRFTSEILFRNDLKREDAVLVYRHGGNYPEDRLVSKMLRLPPGAEIVSTSPEPTHAFEANGAWHVYWRRYYKEGEEKVLELKFRTTEEAGADG